MSEAPDTPSVHPDGGKDLEAAWEHWVKCNQAMSEMQKRHERERLERAQATTEALKLALEKQVCIAEGELP